jgi:hypothetical protein
MNSVYTPILGCGYKCAEDGTCSHPKAATPECHVYACPMLAPELRAEATRLDWLEEQRTRLNAHTGSRYGWKLVQSHLVNRLMLPTPEVCEMAGVDLHDTGLTTDDVRAAIDRARNA